MIDEKIWRNISLSGHRIEQRIAVICQMASHLYSIISWCGSFYNVVRWDSGIFDMFHMVLSSAEKSEQSYYIDVITSLIVEYYRF